MCVTDNFSLSLQSAITATNSMDTVIIATIGQFKLSFMWEQHKFQKWSYIFLCIPVLIDPPQISMLIIHCS